MEEGFKKWWATVPAEYIDAVNEDVARAAFAAGQAAKRESITAIIHQLYETLDAPPSIGRDHGKHHRAGLQRMANSIANAIRQKSTN